MRCLIDAGAQVNAAAEDGISVLQASAAGAVAATRFPCEPRKCCEWHALCVGLLLPSSLHTHTCTALDPPSPPPFTGVLCADSHAAAQRGRKASDVPDAGGRWRRRQCINARARIYGWAHVGGGGVAAAASACCSFTIPRLLARVMNRVMPLCSQTIVWLARGSSSVCSCALCPGQLPRRGNRHAAAGVGRRPQQSRKRPGWARRRRVTQHAATPLGDEGLGPVCFPPCRCRCVFSISVLQMRKRVWVCSHCMQATANFV